MKLAKCILALACAAAACAQSASEVKPEIAGVTLDAKGTPLRKVDLTLVSLATNAVGEPMPTYIAVSGSDGKFEFYGIPPGRYRLLADRAGHLKTRYGAKTPWGAGTILTLRRGAAISALELRLPEQGVISGVVANESPGGSLYVTLLQERYQDGERQMTAIDSTAIGLSGEFLFNRLTPGRYYLLVRPAPGSELDEEMERTTFYPGKTDQGAAEAIVVRGGETTTANFTVVKSRAFRVSGSVTPPPPSGGRATASMRAGGDSLSMFGLSTVVAPDGTFQFSSVPPGSYVLVASIPGNPAPRIAQRSIEVQSDLTGVFLNAEQSSALSGSLKVEGGDGPIPRRILLRAATPAVPSLGAQVGADGTFTVPAILPGVYRPQVADLPAGSYFKAAKLGEKDVFAGIDLTASLATAKLELAISYAGAQIEGVILDEQGKPSEGSAALIPDPALPERPWLYKTGDAGEDGRFQFRGIAPGKYRLFAWEEVEPGAYMDPQFTAAQEAKSVAVEVRENEKKSLSVKRIEVDATPAPGRNGR